MMNEVNYHSEFYNKFDDTEQWIRLSDGCHHNCWNCYCPTEKKAYQIPEIIRNKVVFLDMNFLYAYPNPKEILNNLGSLSVNGKVVYYDFYCGLDFNLLTQDICYALKINRFGRFNNKRRYIYGIRIAWDRTLNEIGMFKEATDMLNRAGYRSKNLQVFMLANGRISWEECCFKLAYLSELCLQVCDCWYDNQRRGSVKPIYWTNEQCIDFGRRCRDHNIDVMFR